MASTGISEFYTGRNVFITGATGFLGKVLVEKLLRSCPGVGKIYILIRQKKGKQLKERLEKMTQDSIFSVLKKEFPGVLEKKLVALQGDCMQLELGLSPSDRTMLTDTISVIFHVAASVRFDDSLRDAILLNTRGTRELAVLALATRHLEVLVHVSTTFCNCVVGTEINERLYPAPVDWRKAIAVAERFSGAQLECLTAKYLGDYPNTYTFSKALGEHVVNELCVGRVPTVICRPSIVVSTLRDPLMGWIDNFNGPVGLLMACGKGLMRSDYQDPDVKLDYIPVDITVKAIVVSSWDMALRSSSEQQNLNIVHCSSGYHRWITLGEVIKMGRTLSRELPLDNVLWVPKGYVIKCPFVAYLNTIAYQLVPAFFLDLALRLSGRKPLLVRLQTRIYNASLQLRYFTFQEWQFENSNFMSQEEKIVAGDRDDWKYDFRSEDAEKFIKNSIHGARRYLLNEPDENLPQAKKHYIRMYWLDKVTMFFFYAFLCWLVLYFEIPDRTKNSLGSWWTSLDAKLL